MSFSSRFPKLIRLGVSVVLVGWRGFSERPSDLAQSLSLLEDFSEQHPWETALPANAQESSKSEDDAGSTSTEHSIKPHTDYRADPMKTELAELSAMEWPNDTAVKESSKQAHLPTQTLATSPNGAFVKIKRTSLLEDDQHSNDSAANATRHAVPGPHARFRVSGFPLEKKHGRSRAFFNGDYEADPSDISGGKPVMKMRAQSESGGNQPVMYWCKQHSVDEAGRALKGLWVLSVQKLVEKGDAQQQQCQGYAVSNAGYSLDSVFIDGKDGGEGHWLKRSADNWVGDLQLKYVK